MSLEGNRESSLDKIDQQVKMGHNQVEFGDISESDMESGKL